MVAAKTPEPGTMFGKWRFIRRTTTPAHITRKVPRVWWLLECTGCQTEHVRMREHIVSGASTHCMTCKNRSMPFAKAHLWNWQAIENMRSRGHTWDEVTAEHGHGCVKSALTQAAHKRGMDSWDYARVFKQDSRFRKVRDMHRSGMTWEKIHRQMPGLFKTFEMVMQQFNKELYRRTYKEVTTLLHSREVTVKLMTGAGWSADKIATTLGVSERTVVRNRSSREPFPTRGMLQTLVRDLRAVQLGDLDWRQAKTHLLALFPQIAPDATQTEIRAWSDALDLFDEELNEVLDD